MAAESDTCEMEDQADEEFFDNLVEDENGGGVLDKGLNVVKASISGVVDVKEDDNVVRTNVERCDHVVDDVTKFEDKKSEENARIKEVDWSAFTYVNNGTGSCSDIFNELGGSSENLFGNIENHPGLENVSDDAQGRDTSTVSAGQYYQEGQYNSEQAVNGQDQSIQYWESLYPGWKYDVYTGQWFQLEGYNENACSLQNYSNSSAFVDSSVGTSQQSGLSYYAQTCQYDGSRCNYNQGYQVNGGFPAHMLFDSQYPDWYYDSIAQEWRTLESFSAAIMPAQEDNHQHSQNLNLTTVEFTQGRNNPSYSNFQEPAVCDSPSVLRNDQSMHCCGTISDNNHQTFNNSRLQSLHKREPVNFSVDQTLQNSYSWDHYACNYSDKQNQQTRYEPSVIATSYEQAYRCSANANGFGEAHCFNPDINLSPHNNEHKREASQQKQFSSSYIDNQKTPNLLQQPNHQNTTQFCTSNEGRSSAGRPPHALVSFGFGGKIIVLNQDSDGGVIDIINLMELVLDTLDASSFGMDARDYFYTLCKHSFPGPLVGANVANKELYRWIDDKIVNCKSSDMNYRKDELLGLLFSLLKIACNYRGKLRSPFGTDRVLKKSDSPESAVADLFASAKKKLTKYDDLGCYVQNFPSERQMQVIALEVQKLLVCGRIREALRLAQEGQLWGPALVLATQLGDQFYDETVKQMALRQLIVGTPLRTLCLLISGQPAHVFYCSDDSNSLSATEDIYLQPSQAGALAMLYNWEENLAIITANRTKDDELVIIHLGDCLMKEKGEVIGAHICYLVAEANFESYSDSARMCLVSADHWRSPRTYASPEAIQRTELYEYSKSLGNAQYLLLPFQPYKLIYAFMLAEVGKLSQSLRYCHAILKCWKIGRAPEMDTWKNLVSSLEERLRIHQQDGYTASSAPAKLVGKFFKLFDSTARVVGGLPPPVPSTSHSNAIHKHERQKGARISSSQSTMEMPSLVPSSSMEPISEWTGNQKSRHNRSISEPDIPTPRKSDSSNDASSSDMHGNGSGFGGFYRFGRVGSQIFQKTVEMVLGAGRPDHQAKLGEKNKFYYDENRKRWVEEGVDLPTEEAALPPPPTTSALEKKVSQQDTKDRLQTENMIGSSALESISPSSSDSSAGIPPISHSSIQSTTRGRMGIRARYVDTFNKSAGMQTNKFPSSVISPKPAGGPTATFFVPTQVSSPSNDIVRTTGEHMQESNFINWSPTSFTDTDSPTSKSSSGALERVPSTGNIRTKTGLTTNNGNSLAPHSRRTVSWSGSFNEVPYDASSTQTPAFAPTEVVYRL